VPAKPLVVPSDYGIGLHEDQGGAPVPATLRQEDPKQPIRRAETWTCDRSLQHRQLLTECKIFQRDGPVLGADQSDASQEHHQRREHA